MEIFYQRQKSFIDRIHWKNLKVEEDINYFTADKKIIRDKLSNLKDLIKNIYFEIKNICKRECMIFCRESIATTQNIVEMYQKKLESLCKFEEDN